METKEILTPSGYKAIIKTSLTYGELEDIQNAMVGENIQFDKDNKPVIDFKAVRAASQKTIQMLLVRIEKDGQPFQGTIRDLPAKDGMMIKEAIDEVTKEAQTDEKKGA